MVARVNKGESASDVARLKKSNKQDQGKERQNDSQEKLIARLASCYRFFSQGNRNHQFGDELVEIGLIECRTHRRQLRDEYRWDSSVL